MAERSKPTSSGGNPGKAGKAGKFGNAGKDDERRALMRAKMALVTAYEAEVAAREHGAGTERAHGALRQAIQAFPQYADELTDFSAALIATPLLPEALPTPATEAVAERAYVRAFAAVFALAPAEVAAPAVAAVATVVSLKALRSARGLSLKVVAERLGLGLDVLSALEAGRVAVSSIPDRLTRLLGETLDTAAEQVRAALDGQGTMMPAFQRSRSGATKDGQALELLDFATLVRESPGMSDDAKAIWLSDEA